MLVRVGRALSRCARQTSRECTRALSSANCLEYLEPEGYLRGRSTPLLILQPAWASSWLQYRPFRSSSHALKGVEVEIQSMGESITEGSIAEILKQQGDSVEEDEVIAQIETDKVTIDIKAPVAGKIADLRVSQSLSGSNNSLKYSTYC